MCSFDLKRFFLWSYVALIFIILPAFQIWAAYLLDTVIKRTDKALSNHELESEWAQVSLSKKFDWIWSEKRWRKLRFLEKNLSFLPDHLKKIIALRRLVFRISLILVALAFLGPTILFVLGNIFC